MLCAAFASQASAALTSWSSQGPDGGHLYALAIDPIHPQTVYASTGGGGVFKSTDGGGSWAAVNGGLGNTFVYSLAFDPDDAAALYAGTGNGVFRSTNGGATWAAVGTGLPGRTAILSLAPARNSQTIYAGTSTNGVYRSANGGATWAQVGSGDFTEAWVRSLAIAPDGTVYAGTGYPGGPTTFDGGVFRSEDGGDTWGEVGTSLLDSSQIRTLGITQTGIVYAGTDDGVFRSTDGGDTWAARGLANSNVITLAIANPQTIYAGTRDGGVAKSTNGGASWSAMNTGLGNRFVYALAIDPAGAVYAGTVGGGGVFKSTDGAAHWAAAGSGLTGAGILSLAIDPSAPQTAYTGTASGVFKRTSVGVGWGAANNGLIPPNRFANALAIDRANPQTLYAGTDGIAEPGANDGVFKSTNGGAGWTGVGLDGMAVHALAIDPSNTQIVYAGTATGVFRTTNGGAGWSALNTGLGAGGVNALAIAADRTLYAGTDDGVYRRAGAGGNWAEVGSSPAAVYSLAIDPTNSRTVYAGTGAAGVFKSTNGATTWVPSGPAAFIASLAVDPANSQIVYAGTESTVYRTTNGGATWSPFNAGLGGGAVNALAVAPSGGVVYAGTTSGGVFTYGDASPAVPTQPAPSPAPPLVAQVNGSKPVHRSSQAHGPKAPHRGADKARFRLIPGQLLINQRISQAAIRRLNAIEAWLDAGIVERDLAGYGIGTRELGAGIVVAGGPAVASRPPSPRPVTPKRGKRGNASGIEVSVAQLLINQRISQAAVRRANALEKRVGGQLTGGDVHDGAITPAILTQGLAIVSTSPTAAIAASATKVAKARRGNPDAVNLTTGQLRINQKISQAAVRGSNRLIGILEAGLSGRNFRAGSLSSADLAPSLR